MSSKGVERLAPLAGVVFVVLIVIAVVIGGETPDNDDSTASIVRFWTENDSSQIWGSSIGAWATLFFVWFAASLRSELRRGEGGEGRLAAISFGGALISATGFLIILGIDFGLADSAEDVPPAVTHTLTVLSNELFFPLAAGYCLFLLAAGISALRSGVLPPWAAWLTIVIGILCVTPVGFFALLVGFLWVLVMAIVLYRRGDEAPVAGAAGPA